MSTKRILCDAFLRRALTAVILSLSPLVVCGCATTQFVELRERPRNPLAERFNTTRLGFAKPSERTVLTVRAAGYRGPDHVGGLLRHASSRVEELDDPSGLAALAELNYLAAESNRLRDLPLASELYLDAAEAAWHYFTTPDAGGRIPDPTDDAHRATAEIYNASAEAILRLARERSDYQFGRSLQMPLSHRWLHFAVPRETVVVNPDSLGAFRFVSDYEIKNLRNRHTAPGLGVPVIAVRRAADVPQPVEEFYTDGMSFSATVLLRFEGRSSRTQRAQSVALEVYDPRVSDCVPVGRQLLPLETDFSTPLAQYLSNPSLSLLDTWGLVRPDRIRRVAGLYMVQPYDPDRIPVLMVHGLWSSPMTWMEMFNDLQADPDIRRRYQFWFYLYPTGEPLAVSAAHLRDELDKVRDSCDPHRTNANLDRMIMVGHSMGGLISHLLTIDSDDRLWNEVSEVPIDDIRATPEEREHIRRVFFFNACPSVSRIVTIASPYAGSRYSNPFTQWLGNTFIWLPGPTLQLHRLLTHQHGLGLTDRELAPRTSVDSLRKQSGILRLVRSTSVPEDVAHHNIIGINSGSSVADWSDGIVSYHSSHREDVDSEISVAAGHSEVHRHPDAIREVRRILLDHLRHLNRDRDFVIPVRQQQHATAAGHALVP